MNNLFEGAVRSDAINLNLLKDDPQPVVDALKKAIPESAYKRVSMLGGLVKPNDVIVLVTPIDDEAPEGRLILPQVMAIRDALDNDCICVVLKETNLQQYFDTMPWPNLVVTDSQDRSRNRTAHQLQHLVGTASWRFRELLERHPLSRPT